MAGPAGPPPVGSGEGPPRAGRHRRRCRGHRPGRPRPDRRSRDAGTGPRRHADPRRRPAREGRLARREPALGHRPRPDHRRGRVPALRNGHAGLGPRGCVVLHARAPRRSPAGRTAAALRTRAAPERDRVRDHRLHDVPRRFRWTAVRHRRQGHRHQQPHLGRPRGQRARADRRVPARLGPPGRRRADRPGSAQPSARTARCPRHRGRPGRRTAGGDRGGARLAGGARRAPRRRRRRRGRRTGDRSRHRLAPAPDASPSRWSARTRGQARRRARRAADRDRAAGADRRFVPSPRRGRRRHQGRPANRDRPRRQCGEPRGRTRYA